MLLNSELIEVKDGNKELNQACHDYMVASGYAKDYATEKSKANNVIKSFCTNKGIFETDKYIITMSMTEPSKDIDKDFLKENYPDVYNTCLLKEVKGVLKLANIKEK